MPAEQVGLTNKQHASHLADGSRTPVTRPATKSRATYRRTFKLFELGAKQMAQIDVRQFAASHMRALVDLTQETVHLSILDGGSVVYVNKIESVQPRCARIRCLAVMRRRIALPRARSCSRIRARNSSRGI